MKYIQTDFQNIISVLDEKVQVNNINNFVIFQKILLFYLKEIMEQ